MYKCGTYHTCICMYMVWPYTYGIAIHIPYAYSYYTIAVHKQHIAIANTVLLLVALSHKFLICMEDCDHYMCGYSRHSAINDITQIVYRKMCTRKLTEVKLKREVILVYWTIFFHHKFFVRCSCWLIWNYM